MSDMARPIDAGDYQKLKLWFFRDLNEEQRLGLFRLLGWPVDALGTQAAQMFALKSVLGQTPIVKAAPEVLRTHSA